ncbi:acyl-CoA dehydrogenase family protein [Marinobacter salarius]|uniref:acyl-CoA dehydrogenase family protein n=1 Tax=Marinobacter salarius TaxID=1420917 RepID=UPI0032ED1510
MLKLTPEEESFRDEVRDFIRANLPANIKYKVDNNLLKKKDDFVRWEKILYANGYYAGSWPVEYGGQGWTVMQQYLFEQENALAGAPFISPYGVNMVGPVIYTFGNTEQKLKWLPPTLRNDIWWCQGYSEPNSGSDLASLKCSARREGDYYIVNGTKMWTTEAHYADMMHILVRTDDTGKKHEGISFLLLDMSDPGVTISPIITIDGLYHTNQTFFDNVKVPVANRIGEEGDGWKMAKFLLENERTAIADTGAKARAVDKMIGMVTRLGEADPGADENILFRVRLADIESQLASVLALERRLVQAWSRGESSAHEPSVLKVRATELQQDMSILMSDLNGVYKGVYNIQRVDSGEILEEGTAVDEASSANYLYLYGRCASVYGGTNEIQRNIIARTFLRNG